MNLSPNARVAYITVMMGKRREKRGKKCFFFIAICQKLFKSLNLFERLLSHRGARMRLKKRVKMLALHSQGLLRHRGTEDRRLGQDFVEWRKQSRNLQQFRYTAAEVWRRFSSRTLFRR